MYKIHERFTFLYINIFDCYLLFIVRFYQLFHIHDSMLNTFIYFSMTYFIYNLSTFSQCTRKNKTNKILCIIIHLNCLKQAITFTMPVALSGSTTSDIFRKCIFIYCLVQKLKFILPSFSLEYYIKTVDKIGTHITLFV